jgi:hypothetical protein
LRIEGGKISLSGRGQAAFNDADRHGGRKRSGAIEHLAQLGTIKRKVTCPREAKAVVRALQS